MNSVHAPDAVRQLLDKGALAEAERLIARHAGEMSPLDRLTLSYRVANARRDFSQAESLARAVLALRPDLPSSHDLLAFALNNQARYYDGLAAADTGLERFPDHPRLLERSYRSARALGMTARAVGILERLIALGIEPAKQHAQMARIYLQLYRGADALVHYHNALEAGHDRSALIVEIATAAERAGLFDAALDYWREAEDTGAANAAETFDAVRRLEQHRTALKGQAVREGGLEALLEMDGEEGLTLTGRDVTAWRRPGAPDLVLIFGGLQSLMGVAPPAIPQTLLSDHRVNALSFSDPSRQLMLGGIPSLAPDYEGTVEALRRLIEAWQIERVTVIAYSAGGYSGLRYALDLKVDQVLMLAGSVVPPPRSDNVLLADLIQRLGHMLMDSRKEVETRGAGIDITLAYGTGSAEDVWQANHLAGLPNVTLKPLEGVATHYLATTHHHDPLIREVLGETRPATRRTALPDEPDPACDLPGAESLSA